MDHLLSQLYTLMSERYSGQLNYMPEYRECQRLRERLFAQLQGGMGADFTGKLQDVLADEALLELEAAFAWGLRLGLALGRV